MSLSVDVRPTPALAAATANGAAGPPSSPSAPPARRTRRGWWAVAAVVVVLAFAFAASLCAGRVWIPPDRAARGLLDGPATDDGLLVREVRLPRAVMAVAVGSALAAAGLLMRTVTGNPLATPSVLGVTNGAQLGMLLALIFAPDAGEVWPAAAAFAGALASAVAVGGMSVGRSARTDRNYLVVGGSLLGGLLGSTTTGVIMLAHMNGALSDWVAGELVKVTWPRVGFAGPLLAAGMAWSGLLIRRVDAMQLGHDVAAGLGVRARAVTLETMAAVTLLAGASVAVAGPVAYVGLIVPQLLSRRLIPSPPARLLACLFGGGLLTAVADLLSRMVPTPKIVPMGIWTASLGALFFVALSARERPAGRPRGA